MVAQHFLLTVNITFCSLQTKSAVVSKHYDNVLKLLLQLQEHCSDKRSKYLDISTPLAFSGESLSAGQFKVTYTGMHLLLHSIDVSAVDIAAQLDPQQVVFIIRACGVLYVTAMKALVKILAGRQSARQELADAAPLCLPMELIKTSVVDFVSLVRDHKERLRSASGDEFVKEICRQHNNPVHVTAQEAPLLSQLSRLMATRHVFSKFWAPFGSRFQELLLFSAWLATLMPETSRVEGDFLLMGYRHKIYCSGITNFALKGVMYVKQLFDLRKAAAQIE